MLLTSEHKSQGCCTNQSGGSSLKARSAEDTAGDVQTVEPFLSLVEPRDMFHTLNSQGSLREGCSPLLCPSTGTDDAFRKKNYKTVILYPEGVWESLKWTLKLCSKAKLWWSQVKSYPSLNWGPAYRGSARLKDLSDSLWQQQVLILLTFRSSGRSGALLLKECSNLRVWMALLSSPASLTAQAPAR